MNAGDLRLHPEADIVPPMTPDWSGREAAFRDDLAYWLAFSGIPVATEVRMPSGGRCDLVVNGEEGPWFVIEAKVAHPLAGIGQVLGYAQGHASQPRPALAVPATLADARVRAACVAAGVALVTSPGDIVDLMWSAS